jgi:hypothetical protein
LVGRDLFLPAGWFIVLFLVLWGLSLAAVLVFPRGWPFRRAAAAIVLLALATRLLLLGHPASDDVNRYLWEGRLVSEGYSPYVHAPRAEDDEDVDPWRDPGDPYWRGINHPRMTAIYPPLMQLFFAGLSSLWYSDKAVKLAMILFDMAALWGVLLALRRRQWPLRWALLYALNPVVLFAFAGQGHLDAIQVALVVASVVAYQRGRYRWMWLALGLAVQVKYVALLCWPLFIRRDNYSSAWIAPVTALAPALVFLPSDGMAMFASLLAFGYEMSFNGPLHALAQQLAGQGGATVVCQLCFLLLYGAGLYLLHPIRRGALTRDPAGGAFFVLGAFLVCAPTVHFWYLSWLVPFLAMRFRWSWFLLTGSIGLTFMARGMEAEYGTWYLPMPVVSVIWLPPALLLLRELVGWYQGWRLRLGHAESEPRSVTVVVPTRNEEDTIAACLASATADSVVTELIVVDGGSVDNTRALARAAGAQVLVHDLPFDQGGGRGGQIARGVAAARGDVVAVVHADTLVEPGALARALFLLRYHRDVPGGALGAVFHGGGRGLSLVAAANDGRAALLGLSFGDQVQFFRRAWLRGRQAFPALPLMEDVELSLRLGQLGPPCFLWCASRVSARRWRAGPAWRRVLLVLRLTASYLVRRRWGSVDVVAMYRQYYRPSARTNVAQRGGSVP